MRIRKIVPEDEQPTHLLAVSEHEMKALRRASEAYIQDEHRERSPYYKETLSRIKAQLEKALIP